MLDLTHPLRLFHVADHWSVELSSPGDAMNADRHLRTALTMLALLGSGATAIAQEEPPNVASKSSAPLVTRITDDGNGNFKVSTGGTVTRKSSIDANGNGTMSLFNNGVQQDYVVTPDGTFPAGSSVIPPDTGASRDAQLMELARQRAADSLKEALGCTDAEWAILWPKIQLIQTLQGAVMPGQKAMAMKGGQNPPPSVNIVHARLEEIQTTGMRPMSR
jgi:hypothetical protein